jgi:hypothetical protein
MNRSAERGSGGLLASAGLLLIGLLAMLAWHRLLDASRAWIDDEQRYLAAFHRAESALSWAMTQYWRGAEQECRRPAGEMFKACLIAGRQPGAWLLSAEGYDRHDAGATVCLYRRVTLHRCDPARSGHGYRPSFILRPVAGNWLDFDPDKAG